MSYKGVEFDGRFGLPPRQNGYCGLKGQPSTLEQSLISGDHQAIQSELSRFQNLPGHLRDVAKRLHTKDIFSLRVARKYWLEEHNLQVAKSSNGILDTANMCAVRPALVKEVNENQAQVEIFTFVRQQNIIEFLPQPKTIQYNPKLTHLIPGQLVACHWNTAVIPISPKDQKTIINHTKQFLHLF